VVVRYSVMIQLLVLRSFQKLRCIPPHLIESSPCPYKVTNIHGSILGRSVDFSEIGYGNRDVAVNRPVDFKVRPVEKISPVDPVDLENRAFLTVRLQSVAASHAGCLYHVITYKMRQDAWGAHERVVHGAKDHTL
jgi:hypothetical protein